jgi:hypothetical protein
MVESVKGFDNQKWRCEGKIVGFRHPPLAIIFPFFTHQNPALFLISKGGT